MQYFESFSTFNFSSEFVTGFTIFLNAIFMLPILIYKWWVGVPLALLYVFCMVKMAREQDRYARGLLLWFSFPGLLSVSAILRVSYLYSIMYLSSIGIFSFLCTVFCVLAYEILFFVKLRKQNHPNHLVSVLIIPPPKLLVIGNEAYQHNAVAKCLAAAFSLCKVNKFLQNIWGVLWIDNSNAMPYNKNNIFYDKRSKNMKQSRKLLCLALSMLMVFSVCGALMVSAASHRVDSGNGSGVEYTGTTYNSIKIHTLSFDTDDYVVIPFAGYAGGTYTLNGQYSKAVSLGYDVVGVINGDFFAMSNGYLSDYLVTNGEVIIGDTDRHSAFGGMTCIMPDGSFKTVAASQLSFATYFNGVEVPGGISYINRRPNRSGESGWSDALYYFDSNSASDKCPLAGVAVICKKLNGTVLAIGGTMEAKVVSAEERSNANGITLAKDEFLLYVRSSSPLAATLKALAPGDSVIVAASETLAASAETVTNATSILSNIGYLVKDGVNLAAQSAFNQTDPHGNAYKAQWTAFGTKADGSWMFFTSEGASGSTGLNMKQVAEYLISQGCTDVIRLDGGGSVAMYLSNAGNGSAGYVENYGRNVPDCLMVVKRSSAALQPSEEVLATLQDLIEQAQDSTNEAAQSALEYAQNILNNEKSVSGDYTKAIMRLQEALNNKGTLSNMLAVASGVSFTDYSEYALTRLQEAYAAASEVFGDPDATADEVAIVTAQLIKWINAKGEYSTGDATYPKMTATDNFKLLKFNTKIGEGDITLFTPGMSIEQASANLKWAGAVLLHKNAHGSYVVEKTINCAAVGTDTYAAEQFGFTVVPENYLVLGAHGETNNTAVREAAVVGKIFVPHGIDIEAQTIGVGAYFSFETADSTGHTFNWKVTKTPTCHEKGSEILTCLHCNETSGSARTIDELDHVYMDGACLLCGDIQPTNVALGKDYTIGYGENHATYTTSLTDGAASPGLSYGPDEWFGFWSKNTQNDVGTVTIDLGDDYVIDYVSVHTYFGNTGDGVVTPASMKVEISSDGTNYTALGEVSYDKPAQASGFTTEWVNFAGEASVTCRYVKLTVVKQGAFAFLNEIGVYGVPVKGEDPDPTPVGKLGDVDGNGKVESYDYMLLKRHILGSFKLTEEGFALADINQDGKVEAPDYMLLKRAILGTYVIADLNA